MYTDPPSWIRSILSPSSVMRPLPPLPATSSMSSVIGLPSSTIEPATCALAAPAAAALAAATIWVGVFDATPFPDGEEEPQPPSAISPNARPARQAPRDESRERAIASGLYPESQS